jgi:hypothetical protein
VLYIKPLPFSIHPFTIHILNIIIDILHSFLFVFFRVSLYLFICFFFWDSLDSCCRKRLLYCGTVFTSRKCHLPLYHYIPIYLTSSKYYRYNKRTLGSGAVLGLLIFFAI